MKTVEDYDNEISQIAAQKATLDARHAQNLRDRAAAVAANTGKDAVDNYMASTYPGPPRKDDAAQPEASAPGGAR